MRDFEKSPCRRTQEASLLIEEGVTDWRLRDLAVRLRQFSST